MKPDPVHRVLRRARCGKTNDEWSLGWRTAQALHVLCPACVERETQGPEREPPDAA